jgi:ferredoxin-NADP reductase
MNLLFRCPHRRLTRPVSPVSRAGAPHAESYVVCLDCGKQFAYDVKQMRVGKPLAASHPAGVLHPQPQPEHKSMLKYFVWAGLPLAYLVGASLKSKKSGKDSEQPPPPPGAEKR